MPKTMLNALSAPFQSNTKNMLFWFRFRCAQIYRLLSATGWGILLVLVVVTAGVWLQGLYLLTQLQAWQIGLTAQVGIGLLHLRRTDGCFLQQGQRFLPGLLLVDYGLLLLPFGVFLALSFHFWATLALTTAIIWAFVPLRRPFERSRKKVLPLPFIPPTAFEWFTILRMQALMVLAGLLLQVGVCWHFGFFLAGSALLLLALPAGFDPVGPRILLPLDRRAFIQRWRALARILQLLLLPGYLLLCLFQKEWWWLTLYVFAAAEIYLLLCFVYQINAWQPDRVRVYNATVLSFSWMFLLLPGLILIPLGQALWFLYKVDQRFFAHEFNRP